MTEPATTVVSAHVAVFVALDAAAVFSAVRANVFSLTETAPPLAPAVRAHLRAAALLAGSSFSAMRAHRGTAAFLTPTGSFSVAAQLRAETVRARSSVSAVETDADAAKYVDTILEALDMIQS